MTRGTSRRFLSECKRSRGSRRAPGKAAYLALEDDGDLEFQFYLADRLRMIRSEMIERMSHAEYVLWTRFHARRQQAEELARKAG